MMEQNAIYQLTFSLQFAVIVTVKLGVFVQYKAEKRKSEDNKEIVRRQTIQWPTEKEEKDKQ